MLLHQGTNVLISSIDVFKNLTFLKTISKCLAAMPCILKVEIDEIISIQNPQLIMFPTVHFRERIEPETSTFNHTMQYRWLNIM